MITKLLYYLVAVISCAAPVTAQPDFPAGIDNRASEHTKERTVQIVDFQTPHPDQPNQSISHRQLPVAQSFVAKKSNVQLRSVGADQASSAPPALNSAAVIDIKTRLRSDFTNAPNADLAVSRTQITYSASGGGCKTTAHKPANFLSSQAQKRRQILYPLVQQAACRHRIPVDLFDALIMQESEYNVLARSSVGAFGLAQLMPGTARDLGADRYSIRSNLDGGARYLKAQLNRFASAPLALAAYNAGPARVAARLAIPNISETRNYVASIIAKWQQLSHHKPLRSVFAAVSENSISAPITHAFNRGAPKIELRASRSAAVLQF